MAQVDVLLSTAKPRAVKYSKNTSVVVPLATNVTILEMTGLDFATQFCCAITPATNAFDVCIISVKFHPDGPYVSIASVAGDYTTPVGLMKRASGSLVTLAAASTGWVIVDISGVVAVKIEASAGTGAGTADVYASAR
jgi:hypothetical protein